MAPTLEGDGLTTEPLGSPTNSDLIFITKWVVCFVILICTLRIVEAKELKYFTKYYTVDKFVLLLMLSH